MAFIAKERTNAQYTVTLKYDDGTAVPKTDVTAFKVTLFCLDDDAQTTLNSRNAQDVYASGAWNLGVTIHATSGLVTFLMTAADNAIVSTATVVKRYERHRLIFDVTASSKRIVIQDEVLVENTEKITT